MSQSPAQKAAQAKFKKAVIEAKKLRAKNPRLTHQDAMKKAFAAMPKSKAKPSVKAKPMAKKVNGWKTKTGKKVVERYEPGVKGNIRLQRKANAGTFRKFTTISGVAVHNDLKQKYVAVANRIEAVKKIIKKDQTDLKELQKMKLKLSKFK